MKASKKSKSSKAPKLTATAPKETVTTKQKVTKLVKQEPAGFRVFVFPEATWNGIKAAAARRDTNTAEIVADAITHHLPEIINELKALGIERGDRRVRMQRPAAWSKLLVASELGLSAQALLTMCMTRSLKTK